MATSDSDDFESADEEIEFRMGTHKKSPTKWIPQHSAIDSDSDDDNDYIASIQGNSWSSEISDENCENYTAVDENLSRSNKNYQTATQSNRQSSRQNLISLQDEISDTIENEKIIEAMSNCNLSKYEQLSINNIKMQSESDEKIETYGNDNLIDDKETGMNKLEIRKKERAQKQQKQRESNKPSGLGAKKLGVKITSKLEKPVNKTSIDDSSNTNVRMQSKNQPPIVQECWKFDDDEATKILQCESLKTEENAWHKKELRETSDIDELIQDNLPEELKSDKKFKEVFNNDGWKNFVDEDGIMNDFDDEKKIKKSSDTSINDNASDKEANSNGSWSNWGSWSVTSLLNTATMGVSTLTSHVTHGLSLLEETIGAPNPTELVQPESSEELDSLEEKLTQESQMPSFGFSNLMSGVSSITKLVETTGTKVITGGLETLETIGKKTMEVLQEGDPGLRKKRALFLNEGEKPILSKVLREAKDKAETAEKTVEEKQQARKIHFETLFDDFQGLVHLEALEMLSKQSNMKIQQRLVTLDADEMISIQETLDEIKELCDLGDEDDEYDDNNLKDRLEMACADLGVQISCEKLFELWKKTETYVSNVSNTESSSASNREIFQMAISSLAQFTAYCVERFHKTAELLLIKERRSTVNETDALVQLTRILSGQIGIVANLFTNCLNERIKKIESPNDEIDIPTIFLEATNASSYIQDAFRLLIPILQVGAI